MLVGEQTIEQEYAPLECIADNYEKVVVSLDDLQHLPAMALACISVFSTESDLCVNSENMNNGNNVLNKTILSEK